MGFWILFNRHVILQIVRLPIISSPGGLLVEDRHDVGCLSSLGYMKFGNIQLHRINIAIVFQGFSQREVYLSPFSK